MHCYFLLARIARVPQNNFKWTKWNLIIRTTEGSTWKKNAFSMATKRIQVKFNELITFLSTLRHSPAFFCDWLSFSRWRLLTYGHRVCNFRCFDVPSEKWKLNDERCRYSTVVFQCGKCALKHYVSVFVCVCVSLCNATEWWINSLSKLHWILIKRPTTIRRHFSSSKYSRLSFIKNLSSFFFSRSHCHQFQIQKLQVSATRSFIFLCSHIERILCVCVCFAVALGSISVYMLLLLLFGWILHVFHLCHLCYYQSETTAQQYLWGIINYSIDARAKAFWCRSFLDSENGK